MKSTKQAIVDYIKKNGAQQVKQLVAHFKVYSTIMHRHLNSLVEAGDLIKIGKAPKVLYQISSANIAKKEETSNKEIIELTFEDNIFLEDNYFMFDSDGRMMKGYEGFIQRCQERRFEIKKQFQMYKSMILSTKKLKDKSGLINGMPYLDKRLGDIYVSDLKFIEAYQIGHFGRSKLGSITYYAKQSQNKSLIDQVVDYIRFPIQSYIQENNIDAICFAPPSISRKIQFISEINKKLHLGLPSLYLEKLFPDGVIIPQKSLKTMEQRIKNATNTIFTKPNQKQFKKVLFIDDFMGSGATINFAAKKLIEQKIAKKVVAISLLGNIDTKYEVINEI